jgi:hypothetical protein
LLVLSYAGLSPFILIIWDVHIAKICSVSWEIIEFFSHHVYMI